MDLQERAPIEALAFDEAVDRAANDLADSVTDGLSASVCEALEDPIVLALMAADRIDRRGVDALLRRMGAALANPSPRPCVGC